MKVRERAWAKRRSETRERIPAEQREFEAGFDAGWWRRGLDNEGVAVALLRRWLAEAVTESGECDPAVAELVRESQEAVTP
jgi:hypothetical protein